MKFCGCLTVGNDSRDESAKKYVKRHSLKRGMCVLLRFLMYYENRFRIDLSTNNGGSTISKK
jgi:hypothetical protein